MLKFSNFSQIKRLYMKVLKRISLLFVASTFLLVASCKKKDSDNDSSENNDIEKEDKDYLTRCNGENLNFTENPVQGMVNNSSFDYKTARVQFVEDYMAIELLSNGYDNCDSSYNGQTNGVTIKIDNENLADGDVYVLEEGDEFFPTDNVINFTSWDDPIYPSNNLTQCGAVQITSIDTASTNAVRSISGYVVANFDDENYISGKFKAIYCR